MSLVPERNFSVARTFSHLRTLQNMFKYKPRQVNTREAPNVTQQSIPFASEVGEDAK